VHDPGVTAEVDWGEATVSLAGVGTGLVRRRIRNDPL
jgi:hypothetical protein